MSSPGRGFGNCGCEGGHAMWSVWASPTAGTAPGREHFRPACRVCAMGRGCAGPHSTSPVRTGTMAITSGPREAVPEVPFLPGQQDVPAGSSGAAQSSQGPPLAGDCRVTRDKGRPEDTGQPTRDSSRAHDYRGLTQPPDPATGVGEAQGEGQQPLGLGTTTALLQSCPALPALGRPQLLVSPSERVPDLRTVL